MVTIPVLDRHPEDEWTLAAPMEVSARTRRTLLALADAIVPDSPRAPTTLLDLTHHALVCLQYMPRSSAKLFLMGMWALNWSPLWRLQGLRPLTSLNVEATRRHLRSAARSRWLPMRLLMYGPLGLFMSAYFDQDYVHRELRYEPRSFVAERIQRRREWLEDESP